MTKEQIEEILVDYNVPFTDSLAKKLLDVFENEKQEMPIDMQISKTIETLKRDLACQIDNHAIPDSINAMRSAIIFLEKLSYITDRPCAVCKFNGEDGCKKWNCVFDDIFRKEQA